MSESELALFNIVLQLLVIEVVLPDSVYLKVHEANGLLHIS